MPPQPLKRAKRHGPHGPRHMTWLGSVVAQIYRSFFACFKGKAWECSSLKNPKFLHLGYFCWWLKSHSQPPLGWCCNPRNNGINCLSTGAGFQPSTVTPRKTNEWHAGMSRYISCSNWWFSGQSFGSSWEVKKKLNVFYQVFGCGSGTIFWWKTNPTLEPVTKGNTGPH